MTLDPIVNVAKRAVVAHRRGLEAHEKSESYGETLTLSVKECHDRFREVCETWEEFVELFFDFGLPWANRQLEMAEMSPEKRGEAREEYNDAQLQRRIARGEASPRVKQEVAEVLAREVEEAEQKSTSVPPLTKAEKQAAYNAKKRAEKVAKGVIADKPPLAPIEHRRLLNSLKGYLVGFDYDDLKKVETFIKENIFKEPQWPSYST